MKQEVSKKIVTALSWALLSLSSSAYSAADPIKRLLDLQLKKGIITQQEYDEFMEATAADAATASHAPPAQATAPAAVPSAAKPGSLAHSTENTPSAPNAQGIAVVSTDTLKVEVFGTVDVSAGYTSKSLVPSGEMPTSIGPWISGGVKVSPAQAQYMTGQYGLFNSALSTSSWGIRANRDIGEGRKVFVLMDSAFNPITGQLTDQSHNQSVNSRYATTAYATSSLNGQLFGKEAYIGFSDPENGRVTVGRNNNFFLDVLNKYAPLQKAGLLTPYGNGVYGGGGGISENARVDNSVKYTNKFGNLNVGVMYGLGGNGGLKRGSQGAVGVIGYETSRYGVQFAYQQFKDVLKTGSDSSTANGIDLTAYDLKAALLVGKYKVNDSFRMQSGFQLTTASNATPDANIPFINNLYGEDVVPGKSRAYVGDDVKINTYHIGGDYDINEKWNVGLAYYYVDLPKFTSASSASFKGGALDALSGLAVYKLYQGTDLYGGFVITHYSGPGFADTSSYVFARNIFTAATGVRFRF